MKTPSNSSQITQSWVEYILTQYENKKNSDSHVTVDYFSCKSATKPGESFNASLIKLDVNAKLMTSGGKVENKIYNLIVKFLSQDPFNRHMVCKLGYQIKEYEMYSQVIPELNSFQAQKTNNAFPIHIPDFIYGKCSRKDYVLVINNMKECGYYTNPKETGLSLDQVKLAVERIAHLHGVSYAYNKENDFLTQFPHYAFNENISQLFKVVVFTSIDNTIPFLRTQEGYESIAEKLVTGKRKIPEKFEILWADQSRHSLLCLTHGDFWSNNLLFLSEQGCSPTELSLIDWQISQWNSPIMDLHYLLNTSTTMELRSNHLTEILSHYYNTFRTITEALDAVPPHWSFAEFRVEFDGLALVGFLMGMCIIQGTLSKAGEKLNKQVGQEGVCCGINHFKLSIKNLAANVLIPMAFSSSCFPVVRSGVKDMFKPIRRELMSGENEIMNQRLLDLVREAEEKGILDVLNI